MAPVIASLPRAGGPIEVRVIGEANRGEEIRLIPDTFESRTVPVQGVSSRVAVLTPTLHGFAWAWAMSLLVAGLLVVSLITLKGESLREAVSATAPLKARSLMDPAAADSWNAMLLAYRGHLSDPERSLYDVFFDESVKFQYPPTALLAIDLLPSALVTDPGAARHGGPLRQLLDAISRLAIGLTLLFSALAVKGTIERLEQRSLSVREATLVTVGCFLLGLTFYPLIRAYQLGQIQVFLDCFIALSAFLLVSGRAAWAGACLGACCLIKPQYALVLLWAGLRKEWRLAGGMCAVGIPVGMFSLFRFGLADHLDYLRVLSDLSRYGEAFWANQSINGILQRALGNGDALRFDPHNFPPYHPVIHATTLATYASLIVASFWWKASWPRGDLERGVSVALVITAATMGSPIAWEHHYGALLPFVLVALPLALAVKPLGRATMPVWVAAYFGMGTILLRPELIYSGSGLNPFGMHIFAGGVLFFVLLIALRSRRAP